MGRVNRNVNGVFLNISGNRTKKPAYVEFTSPQKKAPSKVLIPFISMYNELTGRIKTNIEQLSFLEEIILQQRSIEMMEGMVIYVMRGYIYARIPFFRRDKTDKDIRVLVGTTKKWGTGTPKILSGNPKLIKLSKSKLKSMMTLEVKENISNFNKITK